MLLRKCRFYYRIILIDIYEKCTNNSFSLFASCDRRGKNDIVSPIDKNDSLYIIDIDNITKDKYVNFSSYFKSAKTIILETNENCLYK
jgi:putative methionine-R-sulfoxide reductase with GAF domain